MRFIDSEPKGAFPSKAWRTMPSRRSPRVMSWYSAMALRTFTMRFSMRTPVWVRSIVTMVPMYQCYEHHVKSGERDAASGEWAGTGHSCRTSNVETIDERSPAPAVLTSGPYGGVSHAHSGNLSSHCTYGRLGIR